MWLAGLYGTGPFKITHAWQSISVKHVHPSPARVVGMCRCCILKKTNDAFWKIPLTLSLFSPSEWKGKGMKRNLSSLLKPYWLLNAHTDTDLWSKSSGFTSLLFSGPMAVASGLWGHGCRCTRCSNTAEWFAQSWLDCVLRLGFFGLRWEWKRLHIPWCWSLTSQIQMVCTHLKAQRSTS